MTSSEKQQYELKAAQKNSRRSGLCLLEGESQIESQIFSTRGKLLSSLHRSKRLKAKYLHACCWKWTFPRATGSKIPPFTRRCVTAPGHGALAPRSNFLRPRVVQSTKKTPQRTFPVVIQILSILKFFVYCCHSDIDFTKNCFWQTSFHDHWWKVCSELIHSGAHNSCNISIFY